MGLPSSSNKLCHQSDFIYINIKGVRKWVDDLIWISESMEGVMRILKITLIKCHKYGITPCKPDVGNNILFTGFPIDANSGKIVIKPNPKRM